MSSAVGYLRNSATLTKTITCVDVKSDQTINLTLPSCRDGMVLEIYFTSSEEYLKDSFVHVSSKVDQITGQVCTATSDGSSTKNTINLCKSIELQCGGDDGERISANQVLVYSCRLVNLKGIWRVCGVGPWNEVKQ